ncbi:MAG: hypothetical protein KDK08_17440 [Rhizobiaceae bacterium]|nr:hypothetical protein [Rhizobiaceae bacterium]
MRRNGRTGKAERGGYVLLPGERIGGDEVKHSPFLRSEVVHGSPKDGATANTRLPFDMVNNRCSCQQLFVSLSCATLASQMAPSSEQRDPHGGSKAMQSGMRTQQSPLPAGRDRTALPVRHDFHLFLPAAE